MILFIHGAWHQSFIWNRVATKADLTPDLDLSEGMTLRSHLAAVEALITEPTVIVGHSYGAALAHLAASRRPELVRGLVCLDGFILRPGQAVIDLIPPRIRAAWLAAPMVPPLGVDVMAVGQADRDWLAARLQPQPLASFTEAAPEYEAYAGPRIYVRAAQFHFPPFDRILRDCAQTGWQTEVVDTGHDVMLARPEWVKNVIEQQ